MQNKKPKVIDHNNVYYQRKRNKIGASRYNGAFYYSREIIRNIIPNVKTDRNWITVNLPNLGMDHSIFFVHNNLHPENYAWLKAYEDVVLVCGIPETAERMKEYGRTIYLPLSIDTKEVDMYKAKQKTRDVAFAGRNPKRQGIELPKGVVYLESMPRGDLLRAMSKFRQVYAVGRTALEAIHLGAEILPYDPRFPDPSIWKVIDNREAARILQKELDKIDGKAPAPQAVAHALVQQEEEPAGTDRHEPLPTMENTKREMLNYCKAHNIMGVKDKMKKTEILEKIQEARA